MLNVLLIAALTFIGATQNLQRIISLINFEALLAFFLVNVSMANHFFLRENKRAGIEVVRYLIAPVLGAAVIVSLWVHLLHSAWMAGGTWLVVGVVYMLFKTSFFRKPLPEYTGEV